MQVPDTLLRTVDKSRVANAIETNFAGTYLTVLGIVQNVVLGILIIRTYDALSESITRGGVVTPAFLFSLFGALLAFMIIVLVWYSYQWYPYLDRWAPGLPDSLIPFLLGASQGAVALSIQAPRTYFWAIAVVGVVAILAYVNTSSKLVEADFRPKQVFDLQKRHLSWSVWITAVGVLYSVLMALLSDSRPKPWLLLPPFLSVIGLFWITSHNWNAILRQFWCDAPPPAPAAEGNPIDQPN